MTRKSICVFFFGFQIIAACLSAFGQARKALVIGVSDYPSYTANPIKFAHVDAIQFKKFLEGGSAGTVEIKDLINEDATRDAIWDAVDRLEHEQPTPDTLFVFFSGHAELDSDTSDLYLMPTDGNPKRLSASGISAEQFIRKLKAIGPKNLLIFLDACHTGAAVLAKGSAQSVSVSGTLDPLIETLNKGSKSGVTLFVSAAKDEQSWEDEEFGEGLFTRFLIKGLEGEAAGLNSGRNATVTAGDLQQYLTREVPNRARALGKPAQDPVISPDYQSEYVIAIVPRSPQPSKSTVSPVVNTTDLLRLQTADPELALMVRTGIEQGKPSSDLWTSATNDIVRFFETARPMQSGKLSASTTASLISPKISDDGSLLVACSDPYGLLAIPLKEPATEPKRLPVPSSIPGNQSPILDSCDISVSSDNSFALARLNTIDDKSRLTLINLKTGAMPLNVSEYETGTFLGNLLLVGKGGTFTILDENTWAKLASRDTGNPFSDIVAEPHTGYFALLRRLGADIYWWDNAKSMFTQGSLDLGGVGASRSCDLTGQHLFCVHDAGFWFRGFDAVDGGSGGYGCGSGSPRLFPSSSKVFSPTWELLYGCESDPRALHLLRGVTQSSQVQIAEPVLAARLLADGEVIVVGQLGGIYKFDSVNYGDCCALENVSSEPRPEIAVGNRGVTALFRQTENGGEIDIYQARKLAARLPAGDYSWIREIALSESNHILMLGGESRIRLIRLGNQFQNLRELALECGLPAALEPSDQRIICTIPGSQKIQLRSSISGKLEREFEQHVEPIQHIYFDGDTVISGGAFKGRNQTGITVWKASTGRVISQRNCPVGGAQADKPFSFLKHGNYYAQLDSPTNLVIRQPLTCEPVVSVPVATSTEIKTASGSSAVSIASVNSTALVVLEPWLEAGVFPDWRFDLKTSDVELSADGHDAVVSVGGRILRIPVTRTGFLELIKERIPRDFTGPECKEFFGELACPNLKH